MHTSFRRSLAVALLLACPLASRSALAAVGDPSGSEFLANVYVTDTQETPRAMTDAAGDFVITWFGSGAAGFGIYARRFANDGTPAADETLVNTTAGGGILLPDVAVDQTGDFVVVWTRYRAIGDQYQETYAQRFNALGQKQGSEFRIAPNAQGAQWNPRVAMDAVGNFVVAWEEWNSATSTFDITAQRFSSAGAALGSAFTVNGSNGDSQYLPSIGMDAVGNFAISWSNGTSGGIYQRRYNSGGAPTGVQARVDTQSGTAAGDYSELAMAAGGGYVVTWQAQDSAYPNFSHIWSRRYDAAGSAVGVPSAVSYSANVRQERPQVAVDAFGNFTIAWAGTSNGSYDLIERRFNNDGSAVAPEARINTDTTHAHTLGAVAMGADGDTVIVWQSQGQDDGNSSGIYGQRFIGNVRTIDLGVALSDSPDPVALNTTLTYTATITNNNASVATPGSGAAGGVVATVTLPSGVSFTSASGARWTCTGSGPVICRYAGALASGTNAVLNVVTRTASSGLCTLQASATVIGTEPDSNGSNNNDGEATAIIGASAGTVAFSGSSVTVAESAGSAQFLVARSGGKCGAVGVNYASSDGSATAGNDYTAVAGSLAWADGDAATKTIAVAVIDDTLSEAATETATVVLSGTSGGVTLGSPAASTLKITDNDPKPTIAFTAASESIAENCGCTVSITAQLSTASALDVTVPFTIAGTATQNTDYTVSSPSALTLTIPAGATSANIVLQINDDVPYEGNETVIVTMGTPVNASKGATVKNTLTISENDLKPTVNFTAAAESAAENCACSVTLTAQLSGVSAFSTQVPFTLTGTATQSTDYSMSSPSTTSLTIPAGALTGSIVLQVNDDALDEANETVIVTMGTPVNATRGTTFKNTATINDDDPTPTVQFTGATGTLAEGSSLQITIALSAVSGRDVTVPFTWSGTAKNGTDYTLSPASPVVFIAGESSKSLSLNALTDSTLEVAETAIATIGSPTNATAGTTKKYTATITNTP